MRTEAIPGRTRISTHELTVLSIAVQCCSTHKHCSHRTHAYDDMYCINIQMTHIPSASKHTLCIRRGQHATRIMRRMRKGIAREVQVYTHHKLRCVANSVMNFNYRTTVSSIYYIKVVNITRTGEI